MRASQVSISRLFLTILVALINPVFPGTLEFQLLSKFEMNSSYKFYSKDMIEWIHSQQNHVRKLEIANLQYPAIRNLDTYINQLIKSTNCLIVIDNFQNVNIQLEKTPVILRSQVPLVLLYYQNSGNIHRELISGINSPVLHNVSFIFPDNKPLLCPFSVFFTGLLKYEEICSTINLTEFSRQSKPTSCQVHLGVFPSRYSMKPGSIWKYPKMLSIKLNYLPSYLTTTSSIYPIHGIIQIQVNNKTIVDENTLSQWIYVTREPHPLFSTYHHDIFIILNFERITGRSKFEEEGVFATASVIKFCPACAQKNGRLGIILLTTLAKIDRTRIVHVSFPRPNEMLTWGVRNDFAENLLLTKTILHLTTCEDKLSKYKLTKLFSMEDSYDRLAVAHSNVWASTLRNFSFSRNWSVENKCTLSLPSYFSTSLLLKPYVPQHFIFPYYIRSELDHLRFIGCGRQGYTTIPFQELANVYDTMVWICIAFCIVAVSTSTTGFVKDSNLCENIATGMKLLLEQSNPFPTCVMNVTTIRLLVGSYLLMGIVLSNAYKNTNVYNMVSPRKPIHYEYFSDLVQDNFKVYTRSHSVATQFEPSRGYEKLHVDFKGYTFVLKTEIAARLQEYAEITKSTLGINRADEPLVKNGIQDYVTLLPDIITASSKYIQEKLTGFSQQDLSWGYAEIFMARLHANLTQVELTMLQDSTAECKKTAVILPNFICKDIQKTLVKKQKPNVFIGKEIYSDIQWLFYLSGVVPPHVIQRIHRIGESGVWHWWMRLLTGSDLNGVITNIPEAASMRGNIVIVFVVWIFGISLSTFFSIGELCYVKFNFRCL